MSKTQIVTGGIADDAVSEEHLDATAITGSTELAATPADTDEILISDAGTLKRIDFSHIKANNANLFNAYRNGSFSINHDTWTNVNFNAEAFDLDSKFDVSNGRYTPASTGYYKFNASVVIEFNSSNLGRRVGIRLLKNGNTVAENFQKFVDSSFDGLRQHSVTLSFIDYTSSTSDYYMIYALQNNANGNNSAEIITDAYNTYFSGYKLIR